MHVSCYYVDAAKYIIHVHNHQLFGHTLHWFWSILVLGIDARYLIALV